MDISAEDGTESADAVFAAAVAAYRGAFGVLMIAVAVVCLLVSVLGAWLVTRASRGVPAS